MRIIIATVVEAAGLKSQVEEAGVGGVVSPAGAAFVVPLPAELSAVSSFEKFLAFTLRVYVVEDVRFEIAPSHEVSACQIAVAEVPFLAAFTQKPSQRESVGEVEETKTANSVVGDEAGLPFASFASVNVEVVGDESAGAPGTAAAV